MKNLDAVALILCVGTVVLGFSETSEARNLGSSYSVGSSFVVGDVSGQVTATGEGVAWTAYLDGEIGATPVFSENLENVFLSTYANSVYALKADDGTVKWRFSADSPFYASPVEDQNGNLFASSRAGLLYSLDAQTGAERWSYDLGSEVGYSGVVTRSGLIIVSTAAGVLAAFDSDYAAGVTPIWQLQFGGATGAPIIDWLGNLYIGSDDGLLTSIDTSNGAVRWQVGLGSKAVASPVIDHNGYIYVASYTPGKVFKLDMLTGGVVWESPLGEAQRFFSSPILLGRNELYIGSREGKVFRFITDEVTPTPQIVADFGSEILASPSIGGNGSLQFVTIDGETHDISGEYTLNLGAWPMFGGDSRRSYNQTDTDIDGDNLPDSWELAYGLDPLNDADAQGDIDSDDLSNLAEFQLLSDPVDPDTDNDGMTDGWEVENQLNLFESSDADTDIDGDGLTNVQEFDLGSDIRSIDSDSDGMPDGWEHNYGLNLIDPIDRDLDSDLDGLSNIDEFNYETFPNNPDSDGDGISDGVEVSLGLDPSGDNDDSEIDPDLDGLVNREEIEYGTDINNSDTDGDGVNDGDEVALGRNPTFNEAIIVIVNSLILGS